MSLDDVIRVAGHSIWRTRVHILTSKIEVHVEILGQQISRAYGSRKECVVVAASQVCVVAA